MTKENDIKNYTETVWDYIIIGTGMGGSVLGYSLAKAGKKVLFCEKGSSGISGINEDKSVTHGNYAENVIKPNLKFNDIKIELIKRGRFTDTILDYSHLFHRKLFPLLGSGLGGSSALYGMVLERFFPIDFTPGIYVDTTESSAPDMWPIQYTDLEPYYESAEQLFNVSGGTDPLKSNLQPNVSGSLTKLNSVNQYLFDDLKKKNLSPYALPKGYNPNESCQTCQGFLCAKNCKSDAFKICLKPAIENHGASILSNCEVIKLNSNQTSVSEVEVLYEGRLYKLKAHNFVLAAGALNTPKLLLSSKNNFWPNGLANRSGMVGKNLMRHLIDLYSLSLDKQLGKTGTAKEISFNDFYYWNNLKLGNVQSFGSLPNPDLIIKEYIKKFKGNNLSLISKLIHLCSPFIKPFIKNLTDRSTLLASTIEDLPYLSNEVLLNQNNELILKYRINEYEKNKIKVFRKNLSMVFSDFSPKLIKLSENNELLGHVCGTARFGSNPENSVLDKNNKCHDLENLYVVDASFFPTSGGTNPALTIAANALRVSDHMLAI